MTSFSFRNKELNTQKELRASLKTIYGIGFARASWYSARLGFGYPFFAFCLNSYQITLILGLLNAMLRSETKIRRSMEIKIKLLKDLNSWRGKRHILFLPTRGQRSRTNGRTQKRLRFLKLVT